MKHTIIGINGEVGSCINQFLRSRQEQIIGVDIETKPIKEKVDILHICIPYTKEFVDTVKKYSIIFSPEYIIIYSTVIPGTTNAIGLNAVHSPIEGRHPNLIKAFKTFKRLIGGKCAKQVGQFFINRDIEVETFNDANITELGKLFSSLRYGMNLMVSDEEKKICDKFNVNYDETVLKYQQVYNEGYEKIGDNKFRQSLLVPPKGEIGGHCVIPNNKLLKEYSFLAQFLYEKYDGTKPEIINPLPKVKSKYGT